MLLDLNPVWAEIFFNILLKLVEAKEQTVVQEYKIKSLLTKREIEVLKLIANELTNQEIGKKLFISSKAVQSHKQNVFIKLQVKNSAGLVKKAIKMGADWQKSIESSPFLFNDCTPAIVFSQVAVFKTKNILFSVALVNPVVGMILK